MTKIYLIHGWAGSPNSEKWFGWLKNKTKEIKEIMEFVDDENRNIYKYKIINNINMLPGDLDGSPDDCFLIRLLGGLFLWNIH